MKRTAILLGLLSLATLIGPLGCSTLHRSGAAALQGKWQGREIGVDPSTPRELVFSGNQMEYRGAIPNDWGKGNFTLREDTEPKQILVTLTECGIPQYIGKTCCMIYKIQAGTLSATASEPGTAVAPASFDSPHARHMVFEKK